MRASYGVTGNYPSAPYPYQANLSLVNYNFNNTLVAGYAPSRIENQDLTWETNKQIDLGTDMGFFKNRLNIGVDYYRRNTIGLLYTVPIPSVAGFTNAFGNKGEIQNKGVEINMSSNNVVKQSFSWKSDFNIAFNSNKVVHLGSNDADVITTGDAPLTSILRVGEPMAMFYGYKTAGIFLNQADVDANPSMKFNNTSGTGDYKFVDQNGDGVITPDDRTPLANPRPKFIYGFNNSFSYKSFSLDVRLQGVYGGKVFFLLERFLGQNNRGQNQLVYSAANRWKSEQEPGNGLIPRAYIAARGTSVGLSEGSMDAWLQDASYLKIQNITLSYNLSKKVSSRLHIGSVRVYSTVQNLYTFSNYIGYSPEGNNYGEQATVQSVDYGVYPQARVITFGVNVGI